MDALFKRILALSMMIAVSLTLLGALGAGAPGTTIDITDLRISPNPGFSCENTTISFNVTNNMGGMVDLVTVSVSAKSSTGGADWQSNITLFADRAVSYQSFNWTYPPEGTYDVSVMVSGAGHISSKAGVYTVLPCAPHITLGAIGFAPSTQQPYSNGTVTVDVLNDGHASANNTTVALQASGPYPDTTTVFLGSVLIPFIAEGGSSHPDFIWSPISKDGVYNLTAIAIDESGVMSSKEAKVVVDLKPHPNTVQILGVRMDPLPAMSGQEGNLTIELLFRGNWTSAPIDVKAYAQGGHTYYLGNKTVTSINADGTANVTFPWPSYIEPAEYNVSVSVFGFVPEVITAPSNVVVQMAGNGTYLPQHNWKLEIDGISFAPYPALPGQNVTVTVEVANTGDLDAPPATLTVTAEGPAFYVLGHRVFPSILSDGKVRMDFNWTQPILPGEYTVRAFLTDSGGNQSEMKKAFVLPHVLEASITGTNGTLFYNWTVLNGTAVYNYYYNYNNTTTPNQTGNPNVTVIVPALNETESSATGLSNPVVAGAVGVAAGAVVAILSILGYMLVRGKMSGAQSNPMYENKGQGGENPMHENKMAITEQGTPKKPPIGKNLGLDSHNIQARGQNKGGSNGEEERLLPTVNKKTIASDGQADQGSGRLGRPTVNTASNRKVTKDATWSWPSQRSGPVGIDPTPARISTNVTVPKQTQGATFGEKVNAGAQSPTSLIDPPPGDVDGDGNNEPQGMAINEKGLPGDKKPKKTASANRTAGGEPLGDDSDDDGLIEDHAINTKGTGATRDGRVASGGIEPLDPDDDGDAAVAGNPIKGITVKGGHNPKPPGANKASGGEPLDDDSDGDGLSDAEERKGWDGTIKGNKGINETIPDTKLHVSRDSQDASRISRKSVGSPASYEKNFDPYGLNKHPSSARESPTKASGLRESPTKQSTGQTTVRESPTKQSLRESPTKQSLRESPTKQSTGQTTARESPTKQSLRESPTKQSLRESPTKSNLRESPTKQSLRESPTKSNLRESPTKQGDSFETGDKPTQGQFGSVIDSSTTASPGKRFGIGDTAPENPLGKAADVTYDIQEGKKGLNAVNVKKA